MAAVSIGLLFAFSCYHHHRLWGHINLGMFCGVVAGAVAIALQLVRLEPLGFRAHGHWRVTVDRPLRSWVFFVFAIATGLSGTGYYAYLSLWLFLFATLVAFARSPSVAVLVRGAVYGACTFAAFLFTALPTLFRAHEASGLPVGRPRIDVEVFALKLAHLLLPMPGHRIAYFARQREIYEAANPIPSEASVAALGIVGTVAFVWTVCAVLAPTPRKGRSDTRDLGILNLWMFLLATMGGIASLVAVVGFTQFRSYNRVSIYIHFASLLAIGLAWSRGTWVFKHGRVALALLVLVVGASTWETTYPGPSAGNRRDAADFYLTRQHFFDDVEAHFRGGAMLQLPVVSCPESPRVEGLAPFAELEPYLHTKTLRFSACTMRTRPEDVRLHTLGGQTPHEMVTSARDTGYSAIFLHRLGYEHDGASMHGALTAELGPPVFTLPVDHLEVFDLGARTGAAAGSAM
jgi:phosphoglycerol transferase